MSTVTTESSAIALGWSFQCQVDERRILTAQTHVPLDADPKAINAALDKIADAMDRMEARYKKRQLEKHLKSREMLLEQAQKDMTRIDKKRETEWTTSGRKGAYSPSAKDAADRQNFETTIERISTEITDTNADLRDCKVMLNGAGG